MKERIAFQYALIRYFHDPETEEFLNVGLVLYSRLGEYFQPKILTKYRRITNTFPGADGESFRRFAEHLQRSLSRLSDQINNHNRQKEMFKELPNDVLSLVHAILPLDDSSIRVSEPKFGISNDFGKTFVSLFERLVETHLDIKEKRSRSDDDVWNIYKPPFEQQKLIDRFTKHKISTPLEEFEFDYSWKNGAWNVLKPLSFDLLKPGSIRSKARSWLGAELLLHNSAKDLGHLYFLLGAPQNGNKDLIRAYDNAKLILSSAPNGKFHLIEEDEAEDFARDIKPKFEDYPNL